MPNVYRILSHSLLGMIFSLSLYSCQNSNSSTDSEDDSSQISIGQIDSVYSNILDESRKIWVYVPQSINNGLFGKTEYPVLYLLDGASHFHSVTGMIQQLSTMNGNTIVPEMIVVAITNTNRSRDLTPTHVDIDAFTGDSIRYDNGGGDNFLDFIEQELVPYIESKYPVAPYRTYVGHSFGGLSVIHALISKPHLFNNYIAIDPSLWWDNQAFMRKADSLLKSNNYDGKSLYIGVANTMSKTWTTETVMNDHTRLTLHIRSNLEFANSMASNTSNGLTFDWKYYANDTHGSVPLITEYDALRFLFPWYSFDARDIIFKADSTTSSETLISTVNAHYKIVSEKYGYELKPPAEIINNLGYQLMAQEKYEFAQAFFDLNIKNYPETSNVYDSKGDCYLAQEDSLKALELFTKALEVGPNNYSQPKIDAINDALKK